MMKFEEVKKPIIIAIVTAVLFASVIYLDVVFNVLNYIWDIFKPIAFGFVLAFLFNIPCRFFENKVFFFIKKGEKSVLRRFLAVLLTFIILTGIIVLVIGLFVPALGDSIKVLGGEIGKITENFSLWLDKFISSFNLSPDKTEMVYSKISGFINLLFDKLIILFTESSLHIFDFLGSVFNTVLSVFLAVFLIFGKEKLAEGITKLMLCVMPVKTVSKIIEISRYSSRLFSRFIIGQGFEFVVSGALCLIGLLIFGINNILLITFITAVTSVIPILGGIIGAIPSALIIMIQSPQKALIFLIYTLIVQQLEGNLLYPKIVGNSLGISGTWVLVSVIIGGAAGGILGILIGVPFTAVLLKFIREAVEIKLEKKKLKDSFNAE